MAMFNSDVKLQEGIEIYRNLFFLPLGVLRFSHSIAGEPIEEPEDGKTPAERRLASAGGDQS